MRATLAIAWMFTLDWMRNWFTLISLVMFPVGFFLTMNVLGGASMSQQALFGFLVSGANQVGIVGLSQVAVFNRSYHTQEMFVASPVTPMQYMVGLGLSRLFGGLPLQVLWLTVLLIRGDLSFAAVPAVIGVVLLTYLGGCMIGFFTAAYARSPQHISGVANMLGWLMMLLPPVLYPLDMAHGVWKYLAMVLPVTNAAQLVRLAGGIAQGGLPAVLLHTGLFLLTTTVLGVLVMARSQWREV